MITTADTSSHAVTDTASKLGLSSEDQANVQSVASAVAGFTPVVQALANAGLGAAHVAIINEAAGVLTGAAQGILSVAPAVAAVL